NLSNRSMGFDTECNLALEANGEPRVQAAIGALRDRLLGEHLDVAPQRVAEALRAHGSLIGTIEALRRDAEGRSLAPLEPRISDDVDALVPDAAVIDPERPLVSDEL